MPRLYNIAIKISLVAAAVWAVSIFLKRRVASITDEKNPKAKSASHGRGSSKAYSPAPRFMGKNFYAILQVEKDASEADIKKCK